MLRRMMIFTVVLFVILLSSSFVSAQDALDYGDSVDGEITNREYEVEYIFAGSEGDVIIITLTPEDEFGGLSNPVIILLDSEGDDLTTVESGLGAAALIYDLPEDGEYIIIASRSDGRTGDAVGGYTLTLDVAKELAAGEPVSGVATNEEAQYYFIRPDGDFAILYTHEGGDFSPEITANELGEQYFSNNNLEALITIRGESIDEVIFSVNTRSDLIIVRVGPSLFEFSFGSEDVEFTIEYVLLD